MHPEQGISGALSVQEALALRPSAALSGLLLGADGLEPRSRHRDAQGAPSVSAAHADIVDTVADEPLGPMACGGGGACYGAGHTLYGREEALIKDWSLCKLTDRFLGEGAQEAVTRTERKWQRKFKQLKDVA